MKIDPRQLQSAMQKMGIKQEEVPATEVIIKLQDGGEWVIPNPGVTKVKAMGQESLQITGEIVEREAAPTISEDDVKTVIDQTGADEGAAKAALEKHAGDLAAAILELKKE